MPPMTPWYVREAGIVRNADTGEYMVVLGSPIDLRVPMEAMRQETVLHYHPDYGPSLYRGPSGTDLGNTASIAHATGRPATEFIEYDVPGKGRGRTAFTLTPVSAPAVPGGKRMGIDIEFVNPATGEYTHQHFDSRKEWAEYYNSRTTMLDPEGPVYKHIMNTLLKAEARGRPTQSIFEVEPPSSKPSPPKNMEAEAETKPSPSMRSDTDRPPPSGEANRRPEMDMPTLESPTTAIETHSTTQGKQGQDATRPDMPELASIAKPEHPAPHANLQQESPVQGLAQSRQKLEESLKHLQEANQSQQHDEDSRLNAWRQLVEFLERGPKFKAALSDLLNESPAGQPSGGKITPDMLDHDNGSHVKFVREYAEKLAIRARQANPDHPHKLAIEEHLYRFENASKHAEATSAQKRQAVEQAEQRIAAAKAQIAHFEQRILTELRPFPRNWDQPEFMSTRLPSPAAEEGWLSQGPTRFEDQSRGTPANWDSHVNGFRAELKLANHLAERPELPENVVYWGHRANEKGVDIISVTQKGEAAFYDAKFSSVGKVEPIPGAVDRGSWVNRADEFSHQAKMAIRNSDKLGEHQSTALENLKHGNYTIVFVSFGPDFTIVGEHRVTYRNWMPQN